MPKTKQHLTASHIKMQRCNMAVTEGFENIHWAASALLLSVFKQQLPCIPPSSHFGRHRGRGGRWRPGLQLSYIFHSRVVNPPPMFNVDIAFRQKKKKKGKKRKKKTTVMYSGRRQSGLQGQLYLTVVRQTTNGAFISRESRGCESAHNWWAADFPVVSQSRSEKKTGLS